MAILPLPKKKQALYEVTPFSSFREMLEIARTEAGDTIAIKYKEKSIRRDVTYNELVNRVDVLGTALADLEGGLGHVAILGENSFRWISVYLTVLCSDGAVIPMDSELPFSEIINILNHSDTTTVFFDKTFLEYFKENKALLPNVKNYVCLNLRASEAEDGILSYDALVEKGAAALSEGDERFLHTRAAGGVLKMLIYHSGSLDGLCAVMLTQDNLINEVKSILALTPFYKRTLSVVPYYKSMELVTCLLSSFHSHATVCIGDGYKQFQKNLLEYQPDYLFLPPLYVESIHKKLITTIEKQGRLETFETLIKTSAAMRKVGIDRTKQFFSAIHEMAGGKLEAVYVTGAFVNPESIRFFDDIGFPVLSSYGMAECSSLIAIGREQKKDLHSVGVILPCVQVKIADPDEEGIGEICIRGESTTMGYYKNPGKTAERFELAGWFRTGDTGKITADGRLYIDEINPEKMIFKSGRTVLKAEIEGYLETLPGIETAAVYTGKNADGVELLIEADIVLNDELSDLDKNARVAAVKEKIDRLNNTLPAYKRVSKVHIKKR